MNAAYFQMFARYNQWANNHVIAACKTLEQVDLDAPREAFFPSIIKTLNHLLVGDTLWLARLRGEIRHMALNEVPWPLFDDYKAARIAFDGDLIAYVDGLGDDDIADVVQYKNVAGKPFATPRNVILGHVFNHQTHHRGQVHSQLIGAGCPSLEIDMIYFARLQGYSQ
ncbi:DinB family protein [Thalassospira marina]|uniref:Damage-inducible protein DinB n=1 Tax=Thalassospira marina TaxID=2048283 RepID=A0A2N3KGS4_9PROT|nr:DinB family protein [Thalassospira marina]PKR49745.1 damage-inducible protein DinB [Thalassospira marina]